MKHKSVMPGKCLQAFANKHRCFIGTNMTFTPHCTMNITPLPM